MSRRKKESRASIESAGKHESGRRRCKKTRRRLFGQSVARSVPLLASAKSERERERESLFGCERFWQILKGPLAHRRPCDRATAAQVWALRPACLGSHSRQAKGGPNDSSAGLGEAPKYPGIYVGPDRGRNRRSTCEWPTAVRLRPPFSSSTRPSSRSAPEGTVRNLGTKVAETDVKTPCVGQESRQTGRRNKSNPSLGHFIL